MAIVEIYIKNFKMGGSVVSTSTLLQSVPLSMTDHNLIDPKVKAEMGKAPSLEFAMDVDHPYYDALLQMKTLIRVVFAGETIFRGRVLTIDVDMMGRKQVHCEGDFAFLMDTPQDGSEEKNRETITVHTYLQRLITKHNSMCGDADHKFILGEYPNHYSSSILNEQKIIPAAEQAKQKFGNSSWNTTMDRFEDVLNTFGGYWRTRYVDDTHIYLDWFDLYFRPYDESRQRIEVANNLIDFSGSNELENIFTAVIPIGKQNNKELFLNEYWPSVSSGHAKVNYVLVPEIANLGIFSDDELNKGYHTKEDYQNAINNFGMIYKTVTFENADNCDKLFSYATDWIKNNFLGSITSYDITALDIANQDPTVNPILVGDEVKVVHPSIGEKILTAISIDYDLYNPWKTKYKIGSPNNLLNATYGVANKKSGGKKGSGNGITGGGGGGGGGEDPPTQQQIDKQNAEVTYSSKTDYNVNIELDDSLAFLVHDDQGNKITDPKKALEKLKGYSFELHRAMLEPGWKIDNGETVIQSGKYPKLLTAQNTWRETVEDYLVDDCGLARDKAEVILHTKEGTTWLANIVDDDGNLKPPYSMYPTAANLQKMALRTRQALSGEIKGPADETIHESRLAQYAQEFIGVDLDLNNGGLSYDSIGQVFQFGNGKVKMDATGKTVEFDDMEVIRKEVGPSGETRSFGFYDEGNLDGGIMVSKINNDEYEVKIKASKVDLGDYATVGRLEAVEAKIDDLMAGRIQASVIAADKVIAGKLVTTDTPSGQDVPVSVDADWHNFSIDGTKVASFLGTADVNFDRAAAKKEGARTVTISNSDIVLDGDPDYDADGKFYNVYVEATCSSSLDSSISDTGTQRFKIDATKAWQAGANSVSQRSVAGIRLTGTPTYASSRCTQQSTVTFSDSTTQSNNNTIIDVTDAYNAGATAANAAVTLSHRWDPVNHDGKDRSTFIVENSANSNTKKLYVIAAADKLEYDTSTHKYKTKVYAKGGDAVRGTLEIESGTEAYTAGRNSVGMSSLSVNRISGPSGAVIMVYYTLQNGKKSSQRFTV